MKVNDLKKLIEETISNEVRNKILSENEGEVGESGLQAYLGNKKYGKDGMDALRKAGREGSSKEKMKSIRDKYSKLDEVETGNNKKEYYHIKCEGIPLATFESEKEANDALPDYKSKHKGELIIEKGEYDSHDDMMEKLEEMNDQLEETDNMENTQPNEGNAFTGALAKAKENGNDEFEVDGKEFDVNEEECYECGSGYMEEHDSNLGEGETCECGGQIMEDNCCDSCGKNKGESDNMEEDACPKCGKGLCECGIGLYESKKKKSVRVSESEFIKLINKMVNESVPGLKAAEKAHKESGKENKAAIADLQKRLTKALSFDGNDNPEFPHQIGKGEKVARENTKAQDEEVAKNFAGLQNLEYSIEPSEAFKKRLKMSIEGDRTMGNAPTTEKTNVVASNGAKAEESKENKDGNSIPTPETGKKIEKQIKDREKDKKERVIYKKEAVPTGHNVHESNDKKDKILAEEILKIKNMSFYNKKTQ